MRMIAVLSDQERAGRFGDYLLSRGIENQIEPGSGGWLLWIVDDDKIDPAKAELQAFEADPDAEQFVTAGPHANRIRQEKEETARRRVGKEIDVRTHWFAGVTRPTPVTIALIAICLLVGAFSRLGQWVNNRPDPVAMALYYSPPSEWELSPEEDEEPPADGHRGRGPLGIGQILHGQVWRVVTPIFLHFTILHLIFNMLWMADLGIMIERKRGSIWYALFILGAAVVSNTAEHFISINLRHGGVQFNMFSLFGGMSGVVYALFGYAWIRGRVAPYDRISPAPQTRTIMLIWLFACMTGFLGPVANMAHLAGLLFGMAVAYAPFALKRLGRPL